jgi:hypothetical protein
LCTHGVRIQERGTASNRPFRYCAGFSWQCYSSLGWFGDDTADDQ